MDTIEQFTTIRNLQHQEIDRLEALTERVEALSEQVKALMAWLQEPPSTDLVDTLKALIEAVVRMEARLVAMPAAVAAEIEKPRPGA